MSRSSSSSSSSRVGSDRTRFVGEKTCASWSSAMAVRIRLVRCAISLALFGPYGAQNVMLDMRKRTYIFSRHFAPGDHVTLRHNFRALLFESSGRARSQKKCEEKKRAIHDRYRRRLTNPQVTAVHEHQKKNRRKGTHRSVCHILKCPCFSLNCQNVTFCGLCVRECVCDLGRGVWLCAFCAYLVACCPCCQP